jgi:phosphoglycerate dehydrogenase-like enzyme
MSSFALRTGCMGELPQPEEVGMADTNLLIDRKYQNGSSEPTSPSSTPVSPIPPISPTSRHNPNTHHTVPYYLENQHQATWNRGAHHLIEDSPDKVVGILGYGAIGRQTARVATAMGMTVHAYTLHPRPTPESRHDDSWAPAGLGDPEGVFPSKWFSGSSQEDLHNFLKSGLDLLVVATPLTDNTKSLIGMSEFEALASVGKGRTIISNIARGPVVNTDELIAALDQGLIRGAALDVTDPEPLPDGHPLWSAKNVIITPHVSGASTRYAERALEILRTNLERYSEGRDLVNKIKKKRGY